MTLVSLPSSGKSKNNWNLKSRVEAESSTSGHKHKKKPFINSGKAKMMIDQFAIMWHSILNFKQTVKNLRFYFIPNFFMISMGKFNDENLELPIIYHGYSWKKQDFSQILIWGKINIFNTLIAFLRPCPYENFHCKYLDLKGKSEEILSF